MHMVEPLDGATHTVKLHIIHIMFMLYIGPSGPISTFLSFYYYLNVLMSI